MDLPLGIFTALSIDAIETITKIDAQRSKRSDERSTESGTTEQPGWIEVARTLPQIAGIIKRVDVHLLAHTNAELDRARIVRVTE